MTNPAQICQLPEYHDGDHVPTLDGDRLRLCWNNFGEGWQSFEAIHGWHNFGKDTE